MNVGGSKLPFSQAPSFLPVLAYTPVLTSRAFMVIFPYTRVFPCTMKGGGTCSLVISATGGLAKEATIFYKRLASMLASKWDTPTAAHCAGYDADSLFHCYALQSSQ